MSINVHSLHFWIDEQDPIVLVEPVPFWWKFKFVVIVCYYNAGNIFVYLPTCFIKVLFLGGSARGCEQQGGYRIRAAMAGALTRLELCHREYTEKVLSHTALQWGARAAVGSMARTTSKLTSSQHGSIGKHALPPCTTTEKITTKLQNTYHPEPSENQAVWKSDNQGFQEATFIQKGRRGGDTERGGEAWSHRVEWRGSWTGSPTFTHGG